MRSLSWRSVQERREAEVLLDARIVRTTSFFWQRRILLMGLRRRVGEEAMRPGGFEFRPWPHGGGAGGAGNGRHRGVRLLLMLRRRSRGLPGDRRGQVELPFDENIPDSTTTDDLVLEALRSSASNGLSRRYLSQACRKPGTRQRGRGGAWRR